MATAANNVTRYQGDVQEYYSQELEEYYQARSRNHLQTVVEVYLHAIFTYSVYRPYFGPKIQYRCCTCSVRNKYLLYMYLTLKIFNELLPYLYTID